MGFNEKILKDQVLIRRGFDKIFEEKKNYGIVNRSSKFIFYFCMSGCFGVFFYFFIFESYECERFIYLR
jgi:hypothetical protein